MTRIPVRSLRYVIQPTPDKKAWTGHFTLDTDKGEVSFEIVHAANGEGRWQPTEDFLLSLAEGVLGKVERVMAG